MQVQFKRISFLHFQVNLSIKLHCFYGNCTFDTVVTVPNKDQAPLPSILLSLQVSCCLFPSTVKKSEILPHSKFQTWQDLCFSFTSARAASSTFVYTLMMFSQGSLRVWWPNPRLSNRVRWLCSSRVKPPQNRYLKIKVLRCWSGKEKGSSSHKTKIWIISTRLLRVCLGIKNH